MRNTILAVVLLLAISSTLATKTEMFSKLDRIAGNSFGKTILETIQVELETSAGADPRPKILQLLNELKQETIDSQTAADEEHGRHQANCESTIADIEEAIRRLNNAIGEDGAEKLDLSGKLQAAKDARDSHQASKEAFEKELSDATNSRNANQQLYEDKDTKFSKILNVLAEVRAMIQNRRDTRYQFLEKKEAITGLAQLKSQEFLSITPGYGKLINFLATKAEKALQPSSSEDVAAEEGLDSILRVIDNLIGHFQTEKSNNFQSNEADKALFAETEERLTHNINDEKAAIGALDLEIGTTSSRITELTNRIESNTGILAAKNTDLITTQEGCESENRAYAEATKNRNDQLSILDEVIDIVQNQLTGLREYTENRIVNSDINVD